MNLFIWGVYFCEYHPKSHSHWDYSEKHGPPHWSEIDSNCNGKHQSPINIIDVETVPATFTKGIIETKYEKETTIKSVTNNGHSIQYNFDENLNSIEYASVEYKLKQFHFHSPSEHTLNGVSYPLEIHMVHHSAEKDAYIILSLLAQQGKADTVFSFLQKYLPLPSGETKTVEEKYDFGTTISSAFGVDSLSVYTYKGSLTTPPCSEEVYWIVMKDPIQISEKQLHMIQKLMPHNNHRDIKPLNNRIVYHEIIFDE
ncbi:carbonic anhydrase [Flammeovirga sp. SJP92]|uniref:carbonic anhydrase n=1 Tax=Flammeovirga sp. SJP92 TaxID=1775430 RepID=UPI000787E5DC|nr:carbonic anhydrase family protein [Flammeovirga sp. SJP92]